MAGCNGCGNVSKTSTFNPINMYLNLNNIVGDRLDKGKYILPKSSNLTGNGIIPDYLGKELIGNARRTYDPVKPSEYIRTSTPVPAFSHPMFTIYQ